MPRPERLNFRRAIITDATAQRMAAAGMWDGDPRNLPYVYKSELYQVLVFKTDGQSRYGGADLNGRGGEWPRVIHLSIRRNDRQPIREWRDLQRIKDELVGVNHEAIEIFPAKARLVDSANQYHLFVFADPHVRIPIGFNYRAVSGPGSTGDATMDDLIAGSVQNADDVDVNTPTAREIIERFVAANNYDEIEAAKDAATHWLDRPANNPEIPSLIPDQET